MDERPSVARVVAALLVGALAVQFFYFDPSMPDPIANHFGGSGRANGWMPRSANAAIYWATTGLGAFLAFVLPAIIRRMPVALLNVPHREHWLAPEHEAATRGYLDRALSRFGAGLLALLLVVHHLVFRANLAPEPRLENGPFVAAMLAFFAFVIGWLAAMFRRFHR